MPFIPHTPKEYTLSVCNNNQTNKIVLLAGALAEEVNNATALTTHAALTEIKKNAQVIMAFMTIKTLLSK